MINSTDNNKKPFFFWVILLLIVSIGLFASQILFETYSHPILANRKMKYALLLLVTMTICGLGVYSWKRYGHGWQHKIWIWFYLLSISFLGTMAFVDQFIHHFSYASLVQLHHYRVFLLSALPYTILYLLTRILTREKLNINT